ncbi:hypothetical protein [Allorhizocola rhizosphaerae]|uniref:hypothetical protein n=1 Tax=Allorhizocola rhizosphaerae TaxID=1872709 RepID=UPI000E3C3F14|nr:hypothetical protein [Allorhizocola rhizosphaerae]
MARSKDISVGLLALAALLTAMTACATAANKPSSAGAYGVMVDLYSGRENPKVELSSGVAEEIYGDLDGRAKEFQAVAEPDSKLGFRGFVVTPTGDGKPVLRVTKDSVYSIRSGTHEKLADPAGKYYNLVLNDVKPRLPKDVLDNLP